MKIGLALNSIFTLKRVIIVVVVIAILAVIVVPPCIKKSRDKAARKLLKQIALAEWAIQPECPTACGPDPAYYAFTDGVSETAEAAITRLAQIGFRPDPSIAFHIMRPEIINGENPPDFVAFAAHNSVGSTVYIIYDYFSDIMTALENSDHGGITVTSSVPTLFRYEYDASTKKAVKKPNQTRFGPNPQDVYPARMVVTVEAE